MGWRQPLEDAHTSDGSILDSGPVPAPGMTTVLCLASYHKGFEFLREAKRQGGRVLLVTSLSLKDAEWPRESIDDIFYIPDDKKRWKLDELILGVSHLARRVPIDRIVPLDDFDLEKASALREHLRIPGHGRNDHPLLPRQAGDAGQGAGRRLAGAGVRPRAERRAAARVRRAGAAAVDSEAAPHGRRDRHPQDLRRGRDVGGHRGARQRAVLLPARTVRARRRLPRRLDRLGARGRRGDSQQVRHAAVRRVALGRRLHDAHPRSPRSRTRASCVDDECDASSASLGLVRGVSHTEYIRARDGRLVFLETSARVGGAHIAELVEAATGFNLWAEWAKIEIAGGKAPYTPPVAARRLRRAHRVAGAAGMRRICPPTTTRRSCGGCRRRITRA